MAGVAKAAGIAATDGRSITMRGGMGLVSQVFDEQKLRALEGDMAIGHVRYSTAGDSGLRNAQPFCFEYAHGSMALCHNGNLINATDLRKRLELDGSIFQSSSDTEVIMHLLARARELEVDRRIISSPSLAPW